MPKVTGKLEIEGEIDELLFYRDQEGRNIMRTKGKSHMTSEKYYQDPKYAIVRNHAKEFGRASKLAAVYRRLVYSFYQRAKDHSFSWRVNQLFLELMQEDAVHEPGLRTVVDGLQQTGLQDWLLGLEGNKHRPLQKVLNCEWQWQEASGSLLFTGFIPELALDWPENTSHAVLGIARSRWDFENRYFSTVYSDEQVVAKTDTPIDLVFTAGNPEGAGWELLYVFIGFGVQARRRMKWAKRIHNTVGLVKVRRVESAL